MTLAELTHPDPAPPPEVTPATEPVEIAASALSLTLGARDVLADVDFEVRKGQSVALLGANGAGKSTLLRCFLGAERPTGGHVALFGTDLGGLTWRQAASLHRRCGFVAQQHHLVPRLSVLSNVLHGLLGQHPGPRLWSQAFAPSEMRQDAMAALEQVGLSPYAGQRASRLSGGQSQRVAIARALVGAPRLILADEPAASLDPTAGDEVMALLSRLARDSGATIVFTSHNIDHALRHADRVVALDQGRVRLDRSTIELDLQTLRRIYG